MKWKLKVIYGVGLIICIILLIRLNFKSVSGMKKEYEFKYRVSNDNAQIEGREDDSINHVIRKETVYVPMVELVDELTGNIITYPINQSNQTYGTLEKDYPYPELVRVTANNGKEGYVYATELFQTVNGNEKKNIKVYQFNGVDVIGDFTITE